MQKVLVKNPIEKIAVVKNHCLGGEKNRKYTTGEIVQSVDVNLKKNAFQLILSYNVFYTGGRHMYPL